MTRLRYEEIAPERQVSDQEMYVRLLIRRRRAPPEHWHYFDVRMQKWLGLAGMTHRCEAAARNDTGVVHFYFRPGEFARCPNRAQPDRPFCGLHARTAADNSALGQQGWQGRKQRQHDPYALSEDFSSNGPRCCGRAFSRWASFMQHRRAKHPHPEEQWDWGGRADV